MSGVDVMEEMEEGGRGGRDSTIRPVSEVIVVDFKGVANSTST